MNVRLYAKGNKDKFVIIYLSIYKKTILYLKENIGNRYCFEGYDAGNTLLKRTIEKIYINACVKVKIIPKGGIHTLRHSFVVHLLGYGLNLRFIQELPGYNSSKTTEIYTYMSIASITKIKSPLSYIDLEKQV